MRISISILIFNKAASYEMWWDDKVILPLILSNSTTKVLGIDNNSFKAWVSGHSVYEIFPHSFWKSSIKLKIFQALSLRSSNNILNAGSTFT
mgnify:CR=1 FL=1